MSEHTITRDDIAAGRIPVGLEAVRWEDGTVECRFNLGAPDYLERTGPLDPDRPRTGEILREPADCTECASKCS